jgi:hypothetical protein
MKKVDFRQIEIENIEGVKEAVDLSKIIGNALFTQAKTFEVHELGRSIWRDGEVELKEDEVKILEEQIPQLFPTYIVRMAILNAIR